MSSFLIEISYEKLPSPDGSGDGNPF
jgi:hypothetical protein